MGDAIEFDAVVIGAGVIGLAIANEICDIFDNVIVIEKESDFGQLCQVGTVELYIQDCITSQRVLRQFYV